MELSYNPIYNLVFNCKEPVHLHDFKYVIPLCKLYMFYLIISFFCNAAVLGIFVSIIICDYNRFNRLIALNRMIDYLHIIEYF